MSRMVVLEIKFAVSSVTVLDLAKSGYEVVVGARIQLRLLDIGLQPLDRAKWSSDPSSLVLLVR